MGYRPNTPCRHQGCPELIPYGQKYCEKHKVMHGEKPEELSPKAKANMERCANFLVEMIEKYGREVLEEIEAEERAEAEKQAQEASDT